MRYVLIAIAVLVLVVLVVGGIGWSLPQHHRVTVERDYRATPAALFALISDVRAFPSWRRDVKAVELLPEEGSHLRWRERTKNGAITYVAERMVPNELLVARIADTNLAFGGSWTYELKSGGSDRTTLSITEDGDVYNPIFRFVSCYLIGQSTTIEHYLDDVGKRLSPIVYVASAPSSESSSR